MNSALAGRRRTFSPPLGEITSGAALSLFWTFSLRLKRRYRGDALRARPALFPHSLGNASSPSGLDHCSRSVQASAFSVPVVNAARCATQ